MKFSLSVVLEDTHTLHKVHFPPQIAGASRGGRRYQKFSSVQFSLVLFTLVYNIYSVYSQ